MATKLGRPKTPKSDTKKCTRCLVTKPLTKFTPNKLGANGVHSWCKVCSSAYNSAKRKKEYCPVEQREKHLRYNYGISIEQYNEMLQSQDGKCRICRETPVGSRPLYVDHDHKTGKVRGLLCDHCNRGLGYFFDKIEFFEEAILYIKEHL